VLWASRKRLRELEILRAEVANRDPRMPQDVEDLARRGVAVSKWYLKRFDRRGVDAFRRDLARILLVSGYHLAVVELLSDIKAAEQNPHAVGLERELALVKQTAIDRLSGSTVHGFRYREEEDWPEI
jgi:hypothetical protein